VSFNIEVIAETLPRKSQCGILVMTQRPDIRLLMLVKLANVHFIVMKRVWSLSIIHIYNENNYYSKSHSIE
jgi:hypothetical protein